MSKQMMKDSSPTTPLRGEQNQTELSPVSASSSYTVLTNHTGSSESSYVIPNMATTPERAGSQSSLTDFTLEQAMEKIQELAQDNANLRECLKENNSNAKKQYQTLLTWKEKVRESNKNNLVKFEALHRNIAQLTAENEKYKEIFNSPEKQGTILQELQTRLRDLEEEKSQTQREAEELRQNVSELKQKLSSFSPDSETVFVNNMDVNEVEALKSRCLELSAQVHNFHQQNEQLMLDLEQLRKVKQYLQEDNNKLCEDNLELQKKVQSLLGDLNKSRQSVGGIGGDVKGYDYSQKTEEQKRETKSSITARQDMELLQQQTSIRERESGEVLSGLADELRGKLQQEREVTSQQKQRLGDQDLVLSRLKSQLAEKETMLNHYKEQLETKLAHVTQQHERQQQDLLRQLDGLNTELQHTKSSLEYTGDVQNLKSQVMSLIKEVQESSAQLDASSKALDKKSARVMELEQQLRTQADQMQQSRMEADSLIQSLRYSLTSYEEAVIKEQHEHATTKNQFKDLRTSFNQLVNDYKELLDTFDDYKQKQQQTGPQNKQLMDEINRLTAQTIAAEEAIQYRDDEISRLKSENGQMKNDIDNTIPVLRAQADLWKQDFDAERSARERQAAERDGLLQELKSLQTKNEQLMDELETLSSQSLAEMQRRHAAPTYQQQMQNYLQHPGGQPVYPPARPVPHGSQQSPPGQAAGYQPGRAGNQPGHVQYQQQQQQHHQQRQQQQRQPQTHPPANNDDAMICPQCGLSCPDLDTLQIHVADCIN